MKLKVLIFLIGGLFLSACGYELPKMANSADNSTNSAAQANQNARNQSNQANNAPPVNTNTGTTSSKTDSSETGTKLVLSGNGESATHPCDGREVEVTQTATANRYLLTGECKKIKVDGVSNTINVEKIGEIVVTGVSNRVIYVEGVGGKKPKISKSGTSTFVESKAEADKTALDAN